MDEIEPDYNHDEILRLIVDLSKSKLFGIFSGNQLWGNIRRTVDWFIENNKLMEMRVTLDQHGNEIIFNLESEEEDDKYLQTTKVGLGSKRAGINLGGLKIGEIPDVIGLSTILMCHQFIGRNALPMKSALIF